MWMVYSQRMFFGSDVVAQNEIKLKLITPFSCDRSDGVVGLSLRLSKYKSAFIGIAAPCPKDLICQID